MVAMLAATAGLAPAQTFDSGSNGTNGALDVTNSITLDLPPNGVFHFTTVRIRSGQTLTFRTNALNTPVYLLAQSKVVIENNAYIKVTGKDYSGIAPGAGGPGGFAAHQIYSSGDGQGPGAGTRSNGYYAVFAFPSGNNSNAYGNTLLVPLIGGSGGAGNPSGAAGGGGGGGAILIASSTEVSINGGTIIAMGGRVLTAVAAERFGSLHRSSMVLRTIAFPEATISMCAEVTSVAQGGSALTH